VSQGQVISAEKLLQRHCDDRKRVSEVMRQDADEALAQFHMLPHVQEGSLREDARRALTFKG